MRTIAAVAALFAFGCLQAQNVPELRIDDTIAQNAALKKVAAAYPPAARSMNLAGDVELEASIGINGEVEKTKVIKGHALLAGAAADAAKKWKFKPFSVAGQPARAIAAMVFHFRP